MQYASSLLYGGALVNSQGATYQDYSKLLLRCPFCGEPVFLSAAKHRAEHARLAPKTKRIVLVKECDVVASFAHFPGTASDKCELRALGIKQADIKKSIVRGKNQRLKFFQKRFWKILQGEQDAKAFTIYQLAKKANPFLSEDNLVEIATELTEDVARRFKAHADMKSFASKLLQEAARRPHDLIVAKDQKERDEAMSWLLSLEFDLHLQIVGEAIEFLKTKSASRLLYGFIDLAVAHNARTQDESKLLRLSSLDKSIPQLRKDYQDLIATILASMIAMLVGTQWAIAIHEANLEDKAC
jgi:hypothetical protein